jgi:hypothetical protein
MQTFLPYKDFNRSAMVLDNKRLNKQILEGYQILKVLNNPDPRAAWRNHPAAKMWEGHETALFEYIMAMVGQARIRGIKVDKNMSNLIDLRATTIRNWGNGMPKWYRTEIDRITESHRANLYRKDPEFYDAFRNDMAEPCCDKCQYYWPTHEERNALQRT